MKTKKETIMLIIIVMMTIYIISIIFIDKTNQLTNESSNIPKNTIILNSDCKHKWNILNELDEPPFHTLTVNCSKCGMIQTINLKEEGTIINNVKIDIENIEQ